MFIVSIYGVATPSDMISRTIFDLRIVSYLSYLYSCTPFSLSLSIYIYIYIHIYIYIYIYMFMLRRRPRTPHRP